MTKPPLPFAPPPPPAKPRPVIEPLTLTVETYRSRHVVKTPWHVLPGLPNEDPMVVTKPAPKPRVVRRKA